MIDAISTQQTANWLDAEEEKVLHYLEKNLPELVESFRAHVERGREGILHRLIQSVVRENIGGLSERAVFDKQKNVLEIQLAHNFLLHVPVGRSFSFGRFDVAGDVLLWDGEKSQRISHPIQLLGLLKQEVVPNDQASEERFTRFHYELQNSAANYALALAVMEQRKQRLFSEEHLSASKTTLDWLRLRMQSDQTFDPMIFLEQWIVDGHPVHPGAKLRMGLEVADIIAYSPEFGSVLKPIVLALLKSESQESCMDDRSVNNLLAQDYPWLLETASNYLRTKGLDIEDYRLIPVHPWQYEHVISGKYQKAIEQQHIVVIPDSHIEAAVLLSFRTLAPIQKRGDGKHHLKTALAIQTTGTMRTISAPSAHNGAIVSGILREALQREGNQIRQFSILEERAGAWYDPSDPLIPEKERAELNKNLVTIFREDIGEYLEEDEIAMPASALLAESPASGKLIVIELLEEFAQHHASSRLTDAALDFVGQYAQASLPGFLTMFSKYGISLEGHLQNSIPVFRKGSIVRMYQRDFGGARILRERLAKQGLMRDFHPLSITLTDNIRDARNKLVYPVMQNHFGELLAGIARSLGVEEAILWNPVAEVCREVYANLKKDQGIARQAEEDEEFLFGEQVELKAMTTMRLLGEITNYSYSSVPNALHSSIPLPDAAYNWK